jgi:hypothetical protein
LWGFCELLSEQRGWMRLWICLTIIRKFLWVHEVLVLNPRGENLPDFIIFFCWKHIAGFSLRSVFLLGF